MENKMFGLQETAPAAEQKSEVIEKAAKIGEEHIFNAPDLQFVFNISSKEGTVEAMNIPTRKMVEAMNLSGAQQLQAVQAVIENAFDSGHTVVSRRISSDKVRVAIQPQLGH